MHRLMGVSAGVLIVTVGWGLVGPATAGPTVFPRFRAEEIETTLKVGYAVLLVDLNGDGRQDIVIVDTTRVVWYENPTWRRRTIIEGQTRPDNVCIAAHDIDGDGQLDLALGADWKPFNTRAGGTIQWLKRGRSLDEPWTLYPIGEEPTVHRIRFADVLGEGKPQLVISPLMGRHSSKEKNWMDGVPVRTFVYRIPKDPVKDRWEEVVLDQTLHVVHNFWPIPSADGRRMDLLTASYEGVSLITRDEAGRWVCQRLGAGNQDNPASNRGASEVKLGRLKNGRRIIATIEPWHGHQVVVYTEPGQPGALWNRHVIDDRLKWGHAVWFADLDGDQNEELIIGVRDDLSDRPQERCGVRVYKARNAEGSAWDRQIIEDGGVAVEDLAAADLNGDGRVDIVAVGRRTGNARIYWNQGR
ncbi:MAG: VCBS repeat-containing protein [Gemmataceae bacterium]|nr:VCBS repeat-containing protein [Gemmataceae bacterium]MDW8263849.1 VCBS repeat-containing protein [Gemmataceae bacterium]